MNFNKKEMFYVPETPFSKILKTVGTLLNQLKEYVSEDIEGTK